MDKTQSVGTEKMNKMCKTTSYVQINIWMPALFLVSVQKEGYEEDSKKKPWRE